MKHSTIPVSKEMKDKLDTLYFELKMNKRIKTWDEFMNLLFDKYKL